MNPDLFFIYLCHTVHSCLLQTFNILSLKVNDTMSIESGRVISSQFIFNVKCLSELYCHHILTCVNRPVEMLNVTSLRVIQCSVRHIILCPILKIIMLIFCYRLTLWSMLLPTSTYCIRTKHCVVPMYMELKMWSILLAPIRLSLFIISGKVQVAKFLLSTY